MIPTRSGPVDRPGRHAADDHRWIAAGLDDGKPARGIGRSRYERDQATAGAWSLFCPRVAQPSLAGFRANRFTRYPVLFQAVQADPLLDAFFPRSPRPI